jgi:acetyl-CoA C-acetyltransferase
VSVSKPNVFIEGVGLEISWRDESRNLSELIFDTVSRAVDDAGQGWDGIDSVVLAAQDLADGRSLSSMVTAPAAGCYLRDEIRYGDDGAAAFAAAVTRIEAKESERTIVAAWARASEHNVDAVSRTLFDPIFTTPLGLEELHVAGMRAQAWVQAGGDRGPLQDALSRRKAQASRNPRALRAGGYRPEPCYPLHADALPVWADLVACVVISARPNKVKLAGLGQSSEPFAIGDRELTRMPSLGNAVRISLEEAGRTVQEIDLIELDAMTLYDEAMGLEAMGLAPSGGGFRALASDTRVNPSGGAAAGYCAPAMGLVRIAEAALQLQGRAGVIQLPRVKTAMAIGASIVAAQTHTAVVLEAA